MRKTIQLVLLFTVLRLTGNARAQSTDHAELLTREVVTRSLGEPGGAPESQAAERRQEQDQEHQFVEKANTFVRMWTAFAKEYNEKRTFNVKAAKKLTRAFHELETSNAWPRPLRSKRSTPSAK